MKRTKGRKSSAKKQKVPVFKYVPDDPNPHDLFSRIRLIQFMKDDYLFDDRVEFLKNLETDVWPGRSLNYMVTHSCHLHFLVYDLCNPARGIIDRNLWDPFWNFYGRKKTRVVNGIMGYRAVVLGLAIVEPWVEEQVYRLKYIQEIFQKRNFSELIYDTLKKKFPNIVLYDGYGLSAKAIADTKAVWNPRPAKQLGFYCPPKITTLEPLTFAKFAQFLGSMQEMVSRPRDWTLIYLAWILGCNGLILEAISHTWPVGLYPITGTRAQGNIIFAHHWELSEKVNFMNRRYMLVNETLVSSDYWRGRQRILFQMVWHGENRKLTDLLIFANFSIPWEFEPEPFWIPFIPKLKEVFSKHGMLIRGDVFNDYYTHDE